MTSMVALLVIANTINIGADLGAMADATALVLGGPIHLYPDRLRPVLRADRGVLPSTSATSRLLKWLTLALFAYVATLFMVDVPWGEALRAIAIPPISLDPAYVTMIVAVLGTTISPYLFFWQASEEAEEVDEDPDRHPLKARPEEGHASCNGSNSTRWSGWPSRTWSRSASC